MARALSTDLKERIVSLYYEDQRTMKWISTTLRCSMGLVSKVIHNYDEYGEVKAPSKPMGRRRKLGDEDIAFIHSLLQANPTVYLDEIQTRLAEDRGVKVSVATLSRTLRSQSISRKKITEVVAEEEEEEEAQAL